VGDPDRRRRSRSGRIVDSLIWGVALGAASGAVLGDAIDGIGAGVGALIGAALYTPAEVLTSIGRGAGEVKPLWPSGASDVGRLYDGLGRTPSRLALG
jgi:hypothetical protein